MGLKAYLYNWMGFFIFDTIAFCFFSGVKVIQSRDIGDLFQTSSALQCVPVIFTLCIMTLLSFKLQKLC